jgi:hypothetical protein
MNSSRVLSIVLMSSFFAAAQPGAVFAQETILQNDGYVSGQSVSFQGGFVEQEIAASRFLPTGTAPWRVNRVQFLFGGSTATQTFTLRIWDDAAGTSTPGTEIYFGDFSVTGSNTAMQEIDLTANNITVTGQFRVGFEFQHDGLPSVASDGDGNIQATKNFIYTPYVPGWFQSNAFGVSGDWVIRAGVEPVSAGGGNEPAILTIADVGNDQGKQVRVRFQRSAQDQAGASTPILQYEVHRRVDPLPAPLLAAAPSVWTAEAGLPPRPGILLDGWDYVGSVPAHGDNIYSVVVPTLVDSSVAYGMRRTTFFIRAATSGPLSYYDSPADSGYSLDNLPPAPPAAFIAAYSSGATHLNWDANLEADLWYYRLHRGSTSAFVPGPGNLIATSSDPGYDDVGPAGSYYKLAAVDVNGNVGGYSLVTPQGTAGAPEDGSLAFALASVGPNPARDGRVRLSVTLPSASPARLELLDVGGRRVASREVGSLGAGRHTVELNAGGRLASGLYVARLSQSAKVRSIRIVVRR